MGEELELHMAHNAIADDGMRAIALALPRTLSYLMLNLQSNELGSDAAKSLAAGLPCEAQHIELHLANNKIDADGVRALVAGFPTTLHSLTVDLSCNAIGSAGAAAFAEVPADLNELLLKLGHCDIGDEGVAALAAGLPPNLQRLDLEFRVNGCEDEGGRSLCTRLSHMSSLQALRLNLKHNRLPSAVKRKLLMKLPKSLRSVSVDVDNVAAIRSLADARKSAETIGDGA